MSIGLLATGDEIVHGDTLNTNSHAIAHALSAEGLSLGLHMACSDKEKDMVECLNFLKKDHQVIIVTGGLGPTSDDRTRYALAQVMHEPLLEFPLAIDHITTLYKRATGQEHIELSSGNRQQALFPAQARLLANPLGTAMGAYCKHENTLYFLLPGPPRECLPMFNQSVLPLLQKTAHSTKQILKWQLFGVVESEIASLLDQTLSDLECNTGYRLDVPYLEFKVRCKPELVEEIKRRVEPLVAAHIIATPEKKASERLRSLILEKQISVEIIDEATGGMLQMLLKKPGDGHLIHFTPHKDAQLHFHIKGLQEYWQQSPSKGKTDLIIDYRLEDMQHVQTQTIPFRGPLVVHYAAEWLSFRLFQLINQLHH